MSKSSARRAAKQIETFLEDVSATLSHTSQFVQRRSKLDGVTFIKLLLLAWLKHPNASLVTLARYAKGFGVQISAQGLAKRFHKRAVAYTQGLFEESLRQFCHPHGLPIELLQWFSGIYLLDSTQYMLPAALAQMWPGHGTKGTEAGMKLQLTFEYLRGQVSHVDCSAAAVTDRVYALPSIPARSLHLFDLGYFRLTVFQQIANAQAFFLSRLKSNSVIYWDALGHCRLELDDWCQTLRGDRHEQLVYVGIKERLPARLIVVRCPPEIAAERRRKAKVDAKSHHWNCSQRHLDLLDWNLFITNLPADRFPIEHILRLYRLRWQIELIFKFCKSQLGLDRVQGCGIERIQVQLYLRLILLVLHGYLIAPLRLTEYGELSAVKAWPIFQDTADALMAIFQRRWRKLPALLAELEADLLRFAQKSKRRKHPSSLAFFLTDALSV